MPHYRYRAMDSLGGIVKGELHAASEGGLEDKLQQKKLDLLSCSLCSRTSFFAKKVTRQELIDFSFYLQQLLAAGVPLIEALQDLEESLQTPLLRSVTSELIENISAGATFSAALAEFPQLFDSIYINMVKVGEQSGNLERVFADLNNMLRQQDELLAHMKKISIYPSVVLLVILAVTIFLMAYLVPQLTSFIVNSGGELPIYSRVLIATSHLIATYWWLFVLGFGVLSVAVLLAKRHSPRFVVYWDRCLLSVWLLGPLVKKIKLARFIAYLALMYSSGITLLESIHLSAKVVDNRFIEQALEQVYQRISEGGGVHQSFAAVEVFPSLMLRMLRVGEKTGAIDEALKNVSYFFNRDIKESIAKFEISIEPLVTVFLGLLMAWIILSVISPIYDLILVLDSGR
ncbi:MAG: type II secretion system F family protein [Gammaproteobacteria bacterium]|nr:type II secretion system F family protein [Gammaproteobacteria bacterium]